MTHAFSAGARDFLEKSSGYRAMKLASVFIDVSDLDFEKTSNPVLSDNARKWARKQISKSVSGPSARSAWKSAKKEHMARKPEKGSGVLKYLKWAVVG